MSSIILRWQMMWRIRKKTFTFELHEFHYPALADEVENSCKKTFTFELLELHYPALADEVENSQENPHIRTS